MENALLAANAAVGTDCVICFQPIGNACVFGCGHCVCVSDNVNESCGHRLNTSSCPYCKTPVTEMHFVGASVPHGIAVDETRCLRVPSKKHDSVFSDGERVIHIPTDQQAFLDSHVDIVEWVHGNRFDGVCGLQQNTSSGVIRAVCLLDFADILVVSSPLRVGTPLELECTVDADPHYAGCARSARFTEQTKYEAFRRLCLG